MYYCLLWSGDRIHCCTLLLSIGRLNRVGSDAWWTDREVDGPCGGRAAWWSGRVRGDPVISGLYYYFLFCVFWIYNVCTTTQGSKSQVWMWAVLSQLKRELNIRKLYVKAKFCLFFKSRPANPPQTDQLLQWVFRWKTPNLIFSFWRNWKTHSASAIKLWPDNSLSNRTY